MRNLDKVTELEEARGNVQHGGAAKTLSYCIVNLLVKHMVPENTYANVFRNFRWGGRESNQTHWSSIQPRVVVHR